MNRPVVVMLVALLASVALAACGGGGAPAEPFGDPAAGQQAYTSTCVACHGQDAKGVTGLGKDLTTSTFLADQTDEEMLAFLLVGRQASDPLNTTGVDMPPKGGNPALSEDDLKNIVAYLRTLNQ